MIECQVNMVLRCLVEPVLRDEEVDSVVIRPEKEARWMEWLRKELSEYVHVFHRIRSMANRIC